MSSIAPPLRVFLSVFVLLFAGLARAGSSDWELIDEDEGIRTWKLEVPGQDLPGFRGQAVIDANIEQVMATLLDRKSHTKWMHRCAESSLLKKINDEQAILYNRTDAPWPVWDRDVVLKSNITRAADGLAIEITFENTGSELKPVVDGVIRMPKLVGFYRLKVITARSTEVTYQVESDIGGSIPAWLARRAAKELPYVTLSKLRDRVLGKI